MLSQNTDLVIEGSTSWSDVMILIHDYREFMKRVGTLMFDDFFEIDITPSTEMGIFCPHRLPELVSFCNSNPAYHIISSKSSSVVFNRPVESAKFFELGSGDNNPNIFFVKNIDLDTYLKLKTFEFVNNKF